jgi:hypothetical protein
MAGAVQALDEHHHRGNFRRNFRRIVQRDRTVAVGNAAGFQMASQNVPTRWKGTGSDAVPGNADISSSANRAADLASPNTPASEGASRWRYRA